MIIDHGAHLHLQELYTILESGQLDAEAAAPVRTSIIDLSAQLGMPVQFSEAL
jgi:hypothetical protein